MFFCKRLNVVKCITKNFNRLRSCGVLGSYENEVIEKWKKKFKYENISEIETSIKLILDHIVDKKEVKIILCM